MMWFKGRIGDSLGCLWKNRGLRESVWYEMIVGEKIELEYFFLFQQNVVRRSKLCR